MTPKKPDLKKLSQTPRRAARDIILERRNRFIAAALAGTGLANTGCDEFNEDSTPPIGMESRPPGAAGGPVVCLTVADPNPHPQVCLTLEAEPNPPLPKTEPLPGADPIFPSADGGLISGSDAMDAGSADAGMTDASADAGMGLPDTGAAPQEEPQDGGP